MLLRNLSRLLRKRAPRIHRTSLEAFHTDAYLRHTARRLEHLASLGLPLAGRRVLDVSAGIGDHAMFYMDRGCRVTMTDVREENLEVLRRRFPEADIQRLDMENPGPLHGAPFEVIHCYGLLYHLATPDVAIDYLAGICSGILLLETCVTPGEQEEVRYLKEDPGDPTWAFSGGACRPTRPWIFNRLRRHFPRVYMPTTQPNHPQFITDWAAATPNDNVLTRAVFIASREPIANPLLREDIPMLQTKHP